MVEGFFPKNYRSANEHTSVQSIKLTPELLTKYKNKLITNLQLDNNKPGVSCKRSHKF